MLKLLCITDLIWFIKEEPEKLMKGSVYEDDLFIAYDALVLMTSKETITWMKENKYFHCWFLTMNVFQDGTLYSGRPEGNRPGFMNLYKSLNRDILHSLYFNCILNRSMTDG